MEKLLLIYLQKYKLNYKNNAQLNFSMKTDYFNNILDPTENL